MSKTHPNVIADHLEEMILEGTFADNDRLDEVQLAKRFSVSRTPIREALQRLTQAGLAERIPRRGVFVRQPGAIELLEMFEVMAELEAAAARFAAQRISDAALKELVDTNEECERALQDKDADRYYRANERFHQIIYAQSGNSFLEAEATRLHRRLKPFRRLQLRLRGRLRQSMSEHESILKALSDGDPETAANVTRQHIAVQGDKFHHLIATLKTAAE
ncbi:transcriptional regulator, GntR family [Roseivivax lentus]|uniref:Transcriptional regulator, GntR family n=1 Tax=Roseivivax lentus TaxID=633194 RepID=A0A1N7KS95_9RHOB|nr:GntR family transcriptional regulator [Roseivivax lentus]SIS64421.1 transcriptional regulator, GntR family [Roseivivax lentus]